MVLEMKALAKKYLRLRLLSKYMQLNSFRIRLLRGDTKQLKDQIYEIANINNDTEIKIEKHQKEKFSLWRRLDLKDI